MGPEPVHSGEPGSHLRLRTPAKRRVRSAQDQFETSQATQTHSQIVNPILREADQNGHAFVDSGTASYGMSLSRDEGI